MRRVLFISEAVTLAQVVRLATLARALDPTRFDVHFAASHFDEMIFAGTVFTRTRIHSLAPATVAARVASGRRIYGGRTLRRYVDEERTLLRALGPRLVVGDLRLSLSVSAALERIPYVSLINAYWSPHVVREDFPLPDHPIVNLLGVRLAAHYFPKARPSVFQKYLGPVLWSPPVPLPSWWDALDPRRPTIYVTLGSSGRVDRLPLVVDVAAELGYQVLVATAGRSKLGAVPRHVYVTDYLPGHLAARRAAVVVSNGGSTTGYQALAEGRPILGIAANLDQHLAMTAIQDAGAGLLLRAGTLTREVLAGALRRIVSEPAYTHAAGRLRDEFARWNAPATFARFVDEATA
jgi:UDP:flavonoid glycosyltransferase YjiC (YdhE family)